MTQRAPELAPQRINVVFFGEQQEDHTVDAGALGRSLAAFDDLLAAVRQSTPELRSQPAPTLRVDATQEGSVDIQLVLEALGTAWGTVRDAVNSPDGAAAAQLTNWGVTVFNILMAIKNARDRRILRTRQNVEAGTVVHELDDGENQELPEDVSVAVRTPSVRKAARRLVEPASRSDITRIEFRTPRQTTVVITGADVPSFTDLSVEGDELPAQTFTTAVQPVNVSFEEDGQWRVTDGTTRYTVNIEDEDFLRRVDRHEVTIGKGDTFEVVIRLEQRRNAKGKIESRRTVTEVRSHRPPRPEEIQDSIFGE